MFEIRAADERDLASLPLIEAAADALLTGINGHALRGPLPPGASVEEIAASLLVLVAGRPCIGFARLEELDGEAHLEQLSVLPDYAGRGVGRSLVEACQRWAKEHGYASMSLCTFADVPFNAPFYASCGFRIVAEPSGALQRMRKHEAALGLDEIGRRVAMRVPL